jgi:hypothetical protein
MINGVTTFCENAIESIRKKVKKSGFFGIFLIFLGPNGQFLDKFKDFLDNGG